MEASVRPSGLQDLQQKLLVLLILFCPARVQLEGGLLEEGQRLGERSQLYQVQEVEVEESSGPFTGCELRVKAPPEL